MFYNHPSHLVSVAIISLVAISAWLFCPQSYSAQVAPGYGSYTVWEDWACLHIGLEAGLASSYDRDGGNKDYSHYESPEGLITEEIPATVQTIDGPGIIYRFWMPHLTANRNFPIRMYFDDESTPRLNTDSVALFGGSFGDPNYFSAPLVTTCAGGLVCYEPIPFAQSVRIETENKTLPSTWSSDRHYYQYSYVTFPATTAIESYTSQLTPEKQQARSSVVSQFENVGNHPAGDNPAADIVSTPGCSVPAGDCLALADLDGPGLVRSLNIQKNDANDLELDGLRLQVFYDQNSIPAIDVSVANFFGAGKDRPAYKSLVIGTDSSDGFYCYWPMPFHRSVLVQLCNTTDVPIAIDSAKVVYENKAIDKCRCYLYATENTSVWQAGQIYHTILSVTGRGHYVGDLLYVEQDDYSFQMLEGDDVITVDGTKTLYGTGLEDTYNGGYYYNWVGVQHDEPEGDFPQSAIRPLHGILYVHREQGVEYARADQYRWRIADSIPFTRSIDVKVESRYSRDGCRWSSVGFWYQLPDILEDFDDDDDVDGDDLAGFVSQWLDTESSPCYSAELTGDNEINLADFAVFVEKWLTGV